MMARITNPSNVIDLTGDESDSSDNEGPISAFHSKLLKNFQFQGASSDGDKNRSRQTNITPSLVSQPLNNVGNLSPSLVSRSRSLARVSHHEASRKRSADEAFRADGHHVSPPLGLSLSPFNSNISNLALSKERNDRADFQSLLSKAEAQVGLIGSQENEKTMPIDTQVNNMSIISIAGPTSSPQPLLQADLGSPLRIVPISQTDSARYPSTGLLWTTTGVLSPGKTAATEQPHVALANAIDSGISHPRVDTRTDQSIHHSSSPTTINSSLRTRHISFDSSILPSRGGHPFTAAEKVLLIYLKEELNVPWAEMDRKMGRTNNCCATKYLRRITGVKYSKRELKYGERAAAIKAFLETPDRTIDQVFRLLTEFIQTDALPPTYAASYQRILKNSPFSESPPQLKSKGETQAAVKDSSVRERLRPGARTAVGDMDLKAMARRFPDSPGVSSDAMSSHSSQEELYVLEQTVLERNEYPENSLVIRKKPYLSHHERQSLASELESVDWVGGEEDWKGTSLHLDPDDQEFNALHRCAQTVMNRKPRFPLQLILKNASEAQIAAITRRAKEMPQLRYRSRVSIHSMLNDAANGGFNHLPRRLRIAQRSFASNQASTQALGGTSVQTEIALPCQGSSFGTHITTRLLKRAVCATGAVSASRSMRRIVFDSIAPSRSWTGTSGDVGSVAWSLDNKYFAAGSMCIVDPSSMQYNEPNNLLFGNVHQRTLYELPQHQKPRERPKEGVNASRSMHVSQDPRLFYTVSMVDFSRDNSHMFSVGYDNFLRAYKIEEDSNSPCEMQWAVDHGDEVDLLATSRHLDLLATGCRNIESSVRVYHTTNEQSASYSSYSSSKAKQFYDKKIYPSSLRWGTHSLVKDYLLGGFSPTAGSDGIGTHGETCLWDISRQTPISVTPSAGNIFDCAWSPLSCIFATACSAYGQSVNRGTHSLIRICSPVDMKTWTNRRLELECPARDINDVVFCPYDSNYIAAGATDGAIYFWDIRRPDLPMHEFTHGKPLTELDLGLPRELADVGVRFCGWGDNRSRLYTGSSDGVVKVWDPFRAPEDTHIRDVASFNTGVMSGAFNQDFSSLLIGEVNGTINLLEVGVDPPSSLKYLDRFLFEPSSASTKLHANLPPADDDSGVRIGRRWRKGRQIRMRPMGGFPVRQAVQGKNYNELFVDRGSGANQLREAAVAFQAQLKVENPDAQCKLGLCRESGVTVTEEEAGDSGRAFDRIPQALRASVGYDASKMVPGKLRCLHCGGMATPRIGDVEQEEFPLCERCGFSCFRCGERMKTKKNCDKICCRSCDLEWDAGALGYDLICSGNSKSRKVEVDHVLQSIEKDMEQAGQRGLEDMGNLLHLVEDYYHGLWQDRPSQPL